MAGKTRWWKNGDHPRDESTLIEDPETGARFLTEGKVVRRFRHPDYDGLALCPKCGQAYDVHGWVDNGGEGEIVHPGDWIVTHNGGDIEVEHYDPMAEALAKMNRSN